MADSTPSSPAPTPSFDTAPRLQSASADPASAYAPIAWSAVAAVGIGGFFLLVLLLLGYSSLQRKEPLVAPWLFVLPVLGIAVAFVARRQIANSEGTRIGTPYTVVGWWLCVVGGLIYAAYLATLGYTIRSDADAAFRAWTDKLPGVNPDAADQPALFTAFYGTLPPSQRVGLNPDAANADERARASARDDMRKRFEPLLLKFRQNPLLQQAARYKNECQFVSEGMKAWQYQGGKIECALAATMRTPEGDFLLTVPLEAVVEKGRREWQVKVTDGGLAGELRTPFGHLMGEWVTPSAVLAASEFLAGQKRLAGQRLPLDVMRQAAGPNGPQYLAAAVGGLPAASDAPPPVYGAFAAGRIVSLLDGLPPSDEQAREFRAAWENEPYRFELTGILGEAMGENPRAPSVALLPDRVRVSVPVQYKPRKAEAVAQNAGVRARMILECADPEVMKELAATRATAGTDPRKDRNGIVNDFPALGNRGPILLEKWTVVRFESDLVIIKPPPGPGTPGGPPGM